MHGQVYLFHSFGAFFAIKVYTIKLSRIQASLLFRIYSRFLSLQSLIQFSKAAQKQVDASFVWFWSLEVWSHLHDTRTYNWSKNLTQANMNETQDWKRLNNKQDALSDPVRLYTNKFTLITSWILFWPLVITWMESSSMKGSCLLNIACEHNLAYLFN